MKNLRKEERWLVGIQADYTLFNQIGESVHHGTLFIDDASQGGLGIRSNSPFLAGDILQVRFFYNEEPYAVDGVVTRRVSWGRKTGMRFIANHHWQRSA